jgi:hypothetical protein
MLTFFTTAKPFRGHDGIIQRNALKSWKLLHPDLEVILFGDEVGAAEVCAELGLRHEPHVERFESKYPYVNFMFARAQEIARHEYLCYANCDIIFSSDFLEAFQKSIQWRKRFLLVGRRWDLDITTPIDFERPDWASRVRRLAVTRGEQQDEYWIDFFLFPKGLYTDMPELIVGFCYWDNWMIWRCLSLGEPVLDATAFVAPVHQNHAYSADSQRVKGVATDCRSVRNLQSIGDKSHVLHTDAATHRIGRSGSIRPCGYRKYWRPIHVFFFPLRTAFLHKIWNPIWYPFLDISRPLRTHLGLRSKAAKAGENQ